MLDLQDTFSSTGYDSVVQNLVGVLELGPLTDQWQSSLHYSVPTVPLELRYLRYVGRWVLGIYTQGH